MRRETFESGTLYNMDCREFEPPSDIKMVFTDPPYGMSYGGGRAAGSTPIGARVKAHGMIVGDDLRGDALRELVRDALIKVPSNIEGYVCFSWRTWQEFEGAINDVGWDISACIVWAKNYIGLGNARYRPQHEFLFYCGAGEWRDGKNQSDLWQFPRANIQEYDHPTQKPVDLVERAIINSSERGDLIYDPFMGSGTTGVAATLNRRMFVGCEIDPKYFDVACERLAAAEKKGAGFDFEEGLTDA